jgi:hypothetical protein
MNPLFYPTRREINQIVRLLLRRSGERHLHICPDNGKGGGSRARMPSRKDSHGK